MDAIASGSVFGRAASNQIASEEDDFIMSYLAMYRMAIMAQFARWANLSQQCLFQNKNCDLDMTLIPFATPVPDGCNMALGIG